MRGLALILLLALPCAGCGLTPAAGTSPQGVYDTSALVDDGSFTYELLDVNERVLSVLSTVKAKSLAARFGSRSTPPPQSIGIGDSLVVSIFESAAGGLFAPAAPAGTNGTGSPGTQVVTLPPQTVDRDGMIAVPYAGRITAAGKTPAEISQAIVTALSKLANAPQALVTVTNSASQSVTVVGDVTGGGRIPINIKGDRILEVISQAGGVRALPHETFITLNRGGRTATIKLATLLAHQSENLYVYPGDTIYIAREPQTFTALGAVTTQGDLPIDRANMVLSEAVGKAGGLSDLLADKSAIFIFRWEYGDVIRRLMPFSRLLHGHDAVPVVYRVSFDTGRGYFWARGFEVRTKDIIYVSNAPTVEFLKFVSVIRAVASTVRSIQAADVNTPPP